MAPSAKMDIFHAWEDGSLPPVGYEQGSKMPAPYSYLLDKLIVDSVAKEAERCWVFGNTIRLQNQ